MAPKSNKTPSITPSDAALFSECPRCFYLSKIFKIKRPGASPRPVKTKLLSSTEKEHIRSALAHGAPLQKKSCQFCMYRQLVKATGVENEIAA
jgi:hypothetical protein